MESNNIFVEKNFDNIFIVNPNRILNQYGNPEDRYVKHEELIYYVNLECDLKPRSRLIDGDDKGTTLTQIAIGKVNFLKPNDQDYLTTNWTKLQSDVSDPNVINGELLGLKSVTYKINTSFIPTITITLEDSKGRALMESGDNSIYAAFLTLPYPVFYLTLKGYYGKAIRYPIILQKFNSSFNSNSGNFEITLNFIAYQFNVLTDITMGSLLATPQMYLKRLSEGASVSSSNNSNASLSQISPQTQNVNQVIEQKGLKKIKDVYAKYKDKGLIDKNVPELTLQELITKLDNFVNYSLAQFGQLSLGPLSDIKEYNKIIDEYRKKILTGKGTSWFYTYLSEKNFFIYNDVSGDLNNEDNEKIKIYTYNATKDNQSITENTPEVNSEKYTAIDKLKGIIEEYNKKLLSNPTFGTGGEKYFIPVDINLESIGITIDNDNVDSAKTYELRPDNKKGKANEVQISEINAQLKLVNKINSEVNVNNGQTTPKPKLDYWFFNFDGVNRFNEKLNQIQENLQKYTQDVEKELTDELTKFISDASGLGFVPSLKNIMGVILASAEAFLLLLNDVHVAANDVRNNKKRKNSVKDVDIKNPNDTKSPVYPWPLYVVDKTINCEQKFQITYPGDPSVISKTNAYDYVIWPEVEFVEEFLKGYTQRKTPAAPETNLDKTNEVARVMVSGFDTIPSNTPYSNLETVDYFFEVYERIASIVQYNGFLRKKVTEPKYNGNLIQYLYESEGTNIINSILNLSPDLQLIFSDNGPKFTLQTYIQNLREITSFGQNTYYYNKDRGIFNTQYLQEKIIESPNAVLQSELPLIQITLKGDKSFENYIGSTIHNIRTDYDLMPFTSEQWRRQNLPDGKNKFSFDNDFNKTNSSLFYNTLTKKISNYITPLGNRSNNDKNIIKPFTDFKILNNKIQNPVTLNDFYTNRKEFILTEGNIYYSVFDGGTQTTSIINTPYFVNAVQLGINRELTNQSAPYVEAAYLFLNSLPLATLKEKYLSFINSENKILDYIAPTLTKFAGVHSIPQFWFLKLGSIWHRYKQNIQSNNNFDNLDQIWTNFDALSNYYPAENPTLSYTYNFSGLNYNYSITCQGEIPSAQGTYNKIDLGFYPKLINEYFYFVNKKLIFSANSTIDVITKKLNESIANGDVVLIKTTDSNFGPLTAWSVFVKKQETDRYFIVPSFGTTNNELQTKFANSTNSLFNNPAVFNGSIRTLWGGPNYGYFDTNGIQKPTPKQYFKKINTEQSYQQPFELRIDNEYSSIEEIFSVFEKSELDVFEKFFLEFCETPATTLNPINFKRIYADIISGTFKVSGTSGNDIVKTVQNSQIDILNSTISNKLTINYLYKRSNPTGFDIQSFNYISTVKKYTQTITVNPYTNNLPPALSYTNSLQQCPNEWLTLQQVVGFSTLDGMPYDTTGGSKITSFFKDFNIEFTVGNINTFNRLIKMYATLKDTAGTNESLSDTFRNNIDNIFNNDNNLYAEVFEGIINYLIINLPSSEKSETQEISTVIEGYQSKVELYDMFKAVNDKWIASNDYNTKTLFEDFLFLDRANRDIGGDIYLDITMVNKYLKNVSPKTNVFTIIDSIFKSHNFVTFSMPAYINFYNSYVPSKDSKNNEPGQNEFANNLFGTFTNVDYQKTTAKLVSIYNEKPSNQLPIQSSKNGYKDDGLNIDDASNNELRNPCQPKDFAKSNKVVGFSVDFQLQNQSVFENISVSQDLGKATSESLASIDALANSSGIQTSTQSVSLYNIYKDRSYSCTVDGFGNAMIQPTMYFILRNIPLFAGSYYITEVTHTISLDSFKTSFTGTRQSAHTLPRVENTFQTLKTQLLSTINSNLKNNKTTVGTSQTLNKSAIKSLMVSNINGNENLNTSSLCSSVLYSDFAEYQPYTQNAIVETESKIHILISDNTDNPLSFYTVAAIFTIASQFETLSNSSLPKYGFKYIGNNLGDITLEYPIYGELKQQYLSQEFTCLTGSDKKNRPYAVFNSVEDCINFVSNRYSEFFANAIPVSDTVSDLINTVENYTPEQTLAFKEKVAQAWIEYFPYTKVNDYPNIYEDFKTSNKSDYDILLSKIPTQFYI